MAFTKSTHITDVPIYHTHHHSHPLSFIQIFHPTISSLTFPVHFISMLTSHTHCHAIPFSIPPSPLTPHSFSKPIKPLPCSSPHPLYIFHQPVAHPCACIAAPKSFQSPLTASQIHLPVCMDPCKPFHHFFHLHSPHITMLYMPTAHSLTPILHYTHFLFFFFYPHHQRKRGEICRRKFWLLCLSLLRSLRSCLQEQLNPGQWENMELQEILCSPIHLNLVARQGFACFPWTQWRVLSGEPSGHRWRRRSASGPARADQHVRARGELSQGSSWGDEAEGGV